MRGDVTKETVQRFVRACLKTTTRSGQKLRRSTVTQYVVCLQGIYGTAIDEGWYVGDNPFKVAWSQRRDKVTHFLSREPAAPTGWRVKTK